MIAIDRGHKPCPHGLSTINSHSLGNNFIQVELLFQFAAKIVVILVQIFTVIFQSV